MIERLLPDGVEAQSHTGPPLPASLLAAEEPGVVDAVPARRAEYAAVRACARTALGRLGVAPVAIPADPDRAPRWPPGIVGSMTHCTGYQAAAVGRSDHWRGIGIDAEPLEPLPPEVLDLVLDGTERAAAARSDPRLCADRVVFSAKESVYKVWYPLTRSWLGFEDVHVRLGAGTFTARIDRPDLGLTELHGRWTVGAGHVLTAVTLARD